MTRNRALPLALGAALLLLLPHAALAKPVARAEARIEGVGGSGVSGKAIFEEMPDGTVRITVKARGLAPGGHGIHVHEGAHCGGEGAAHAGGHFDPDASKVHAGPQTAIGTHHAGDLGNIRADARGRAKLVLTTKQLTVAAGPRSVAGRAIVLHANPDNLTNEPANGGSGPRVACGLIEAKK